MTNENLNSKTGNLTKLGMKRANISTENGYDPMTIATVLEVPIEAVIEFLNR